MEELFEDVFYYDETSPSCLRWKQDRWSGWHHKIKQAEKDSPAGGIVSGGYYSIFLNGKLETAHRYIYEHFNGKIPDGMFIDHINGIRTDNRIENLRVVDSNGNARNRKKRSDNKTGITGVYYHYGSRDFPAYVAASWMDLDGKARAKCFSIIKLGEEEALRQACEFRKQKVKELNELGEGYSEDHGVR